MEVGDWVQVPVLVLIRDGRLTRPVPSVLDIEALFPSLPPDRVSEEGPKAQVKPGPARHRHGPLRAPQSSPADAHDHRRAPRDPDRCSLETCHRQVDRADGGPFGRLVGGRYRALPSARRRRLAGGCRDLPHRSYERLLHKWFDGLSRRSLRADGNCPTLGALSDYEPGRGTATSPTLPWHYARRSRYRRGGAHDVLPTLGAVNPWL